MQECVPLPLASVASHFQHPLTHKTFFIRMKKISFWLTCAWLFASCNSPSEADQASVQQQLEQINQTIAAEPEPLNMMDYPNTLPEKFKQENESEFKLIQKKAKDLSLKKERSVALLKEASQKSEQLLQLKPSDLKQQFEQQVQPVVKEADDAIQRYNRDLGNLKNTVDSIAASYGRKDQ
jgi:hypothetical protein